MATKNLIIQQIRDAFAPNHFPGNWCLRASNEGEEPFLLEEEFQDKTNWSILDADFIDQAPGGFGSALSFFSDEAFRFYLPAYLIADLEDKLNSVDPVFHLTYGLDDAFGQTFISTKRYGGRTWIDRAKYRFSMFTREEVIAIIAYLRFKMDIDDMEKESIAQALNNYWEKRQEQAIPRSELND